MKINLLLVVVVLVALKYFGVEPVASWGWVWIFSPLWISAIIMVVAMLLMFAVTLLLATFGVKKDFKRVVSSPIRKRR